MLDEGASIIDIGAQSSKPGAMQMSSKEELKKQTRKNKWLNGEGMCEWCGRHKATINLNLEYGSYRECRYCWDRS